MRADHPQVLTAILPHEVTHVVLADLFTTQQIPRWADEGIAVLAEPRAEQQVRAAELQEPLEAGRIFDLSKLMAMDYPAAKDWSLYYAQSVSLTRFLVEQGPPEQFVQFVQRFAARWDRGRPARACMESAASPSFKNDGSSMRAADRIAQRRRDANRRIKALAAELK